MATPEAIPPVAAPAAVSAWLTRFEEALNAPARADWSQLFGDECYWRDFVAFTWNIITLEGRDAIAAMVKQQGGSVGATDFKAGDPTLPMTDESQGWFTFNTSTARCRGHVQLRGGRAYVLITTMLELIGHEEVGGSLRPRPDGIEHRAEKGRRTWLHGRMESARTLGHSVQPYCLIVGGGHNGLMLAARLKRLGVPALVVDAMEKPGDGWRARYDSLYLHDPVFLDHFPYLPFPEAELDVPPYGMVDYDPLRGYLHSDDLYWGYGGTRGRAADWQKQVVQQATPKMLDAITAVGFDGLWIDTLGYPNHAEVIIAEVQDATGESPIVSPNGRFVFFDLREYQREAEQRLGHTGVQTLKQRTLRDLG